MLREIDSRAARTDLDVNGFIISHISSAWSRDPNTSSFQDRVKILREIDSRAARTDLYVDGSIISHISSAWSIDPNTSSFQYRVI